MKKKKNENSMIKKLIGALFLIILILYAVKCMSLNFFGVTTTGMITETTQRNAKSSSKSSSRYSNTAHYYFYVDGKKYNGQVSYKTNSPIVRKQDQKEIAETVQYIKACPAINTLKKYNSNSLFSNILWIALIAFGIFGIVIIYKKGKNDKAVFKEGNDDGNKDK